MLLIATRIVTQPPGSSHQLLLANIILSPSMHVHWAISTDGLPTLQRTNLHLAKSYRAKQWRLIYVATFLTPLVHLRHLSRVLYIGYLQCVVPRIYFGGKLSRLGRIYFVTWTHFISELVFRVKYSKSSDPTMNLSLL